jgi:hypothetical protein
MERRRAPPLAAQMDVDVEPGEAFVLLGDDCEQFAAAQERSPNSPRW